MWRIRSFLLILVVAVLTSACGGGVQRLPTPTLGREFNPTRRPTETLPPPTFTPTASPTITKTFTPTLSPTPTLTPLPTETPKPVYPRTTAQVVRVIDGDTIEVRLVGGRTITATVRYIGINAPEMSASGKPEPYAQEATEANRILVGNKTVYLEKDVSETDKYGRLLRYVFLEDGTFVNAELVRLGLAQAVPYPPDTRYQALLTEMQQEAYAARAGMWENATVPLPVVRTPTARAGLFSPTPTLRPTGGSPTRTPTRSNGTPPANSTIGSTPQELVTLTSPVPRGSVVAITVQTLPNIACAAAIYFPNRPEVRSTVSSKTGICSWSWSVSSYVPPGTYTVLVTTGDTTKQYQLEVE